jgi:uncharacterized protein YndB with AHSA1/START domain
MELPVKATVTHSFAAPAEKVFDAWFDPAMISRFMFGPQLRDEQIISIHPGKKVADSFSFVVRRQGNDYEHIGEYIVIDRPKRLVFTWAVRQDLPVRSQIVINIEPHKSGCTLTLTHEMAKEAENFVGQAKAAWSKMLNALDGAVG